MMNSRFGDVEFQNSKNEARVEARQWNSFRASEVVSSKAWCPEWLAERPGEMSERERVNIARQGEKGKPPSPKRN